MAMLSRYLRLNAIWLFGGSMVQTGVAFVCSLFLMGMLLPEDSDDML